ncbi:MAG: hypothetical protein EHM61_24285 [Acidobacteria bacterium]|nr:MAG: hypothetical protein EHM61_24285 [Acidobacteriota bacterium]
MKKVFLFLAFWTIQAAAKPIEPVTVDIWSGKARIAAGNVSLGLTSDPLFVTVKSGDDVRIQGVPSRMFGFQTGGKMTWFVKATSLHRLFISARSRFWEETGWSGNRRAPQDKRASPRFKESHEARSIKWDRACTRRCGKGTGPFEELKLVVPTK